MTEKQRLYQLYLKRCTEEGIAFDLFDFEAEIGSDLSYSEGLQQLEDKLFSKLAEMKDKEQAYKAEQIEKKERNTQQQNTNEREAHKVFTEPCNFLIIGKKGSAKSSLGFKFLQENYNNGKKAYTFNFPKPELLDNLPFKVQNLNTLKQLYNLTDSVCLIDEAHRYFDVLNKTVNEDLKRLLAESRQNNNSFIFITHNSYFITRGLFSYIDVRIIKEVNEGHWDMERPHMKQLYSDTFISGKEWFFIDSDFWRGKERFDKPDWFTEELSTVYRNEKIEKEDFFSKVRRVAKLCDHPRPRAEKIKNT